MMTTGPSGAVSGAHRNSPGRNASTLAAIDPGSSAIARIGAAVRQSAAVMVPARSVRREKRVDGAWDAPAVATAVSVGVRNMMSGVVILSILF